MNDLITSTLNINSPLVSERRIELDWLRNATVMLVFLHHAGMPFNGDTWHIMNGQTSKLLDDIMVYFEQWRLPLLLLISGAGTVKAFSKQSTLQFVKERSLRLIVPLLFLERWWSFPLKLIFSLSIVTILTLIFTPKH